ncbi:MAG: hypothetical protein OTJ44_00740 [Planctomycetota bacterium]|nr:hypothetical protein [Planctomycetota bacterium]
MHPLAILTATLCLPLPTFAQDWDWLARPEAGSIGNIAKAGHGWAIEGVGDINADGFADYATSARGASSVGGPGSGVISVISGADGTLLSEFAGQDRYEGAGYSLAYLGVQSIGVGTAPLLAIGSPFTSNISNGLWSGRTYLINAADGTLLDSIEGFGGVTLHGANVCAVDFDGDGDQELAVSSVGILSLTGEIEVYDWDGTALTLLNSFLGSTPFEVFGYSMSSIGNHDGSGDGSEELIIGAPYASVNGFSRAGRLAGSNGFVLSTDAASGMLGWSISTVDFNGDGAVDLVAGAPKANEVHYWNGATLSGGRDPNFTLTGAYANSRFGHSVAWIGDTNFDGAHELAIGAPYAGINEGGQVVLVDLAASGGATILTTISEALYGNAGTRTGLSVAGIGDTNGTGNPDLAFGAPKFGTTRYGAVSVWASPDENVGAILLTPSSMAGSYEPNTDVRLDVGNLKSSGQTAVYVGTGQAATGDLVTFDGEDFQLNLTGSLLAGSDLNTSGATSLFYTIDPLAPNGLELFFQTVEKSGDYLRIGTVESITIVVTQPFTLTLDVATIEVTVPFTLTASGGFASKRAFFYYSIDGFGSDSALTNMASNNFTINDTGLQNPQDFSVFGRLNGNTADGNGEATYTMTLPAGAGIEGLNFWFSAISVDAMGSGTERMDALNAGIIGVQP